MGTDEGIKAIVGNVAELFRQVEQRCVDVNSRGSLQIRCRAVFKEQSAIQSCAMTNGSVGSVIVWNQPYSNTLDRSSLVFREYNGGLIFSDEMGNRMYLNQPEQLSEIKYSPELSLAREYGWKEDNVAEFVSSSALAERCVIRFVDLVDRHTRGEIRRRTFN